MRIVLATSLKERLLGLLNRRVCCKGEVLLLAPCKSIHTFGMRGPIDIAFIDRNARVLASERCVPAARMRSHQGAAAVLEQRSDPALPWLKQGDCIQLGTSLLKFPAKYS